MQDIRRDDILDSGATLSAMIDMVFQMHPSSLRTCVMLRKDRPDLPDRLGVDFVGFDVEDDFVVGYGLDFNGLYRNLPDICSLSPKALAGAGGNCP